MRGRGAVDGSGRGIVERDGSDMLRVITEGCRVVLVTATEAEAHRCWNACREPQTYVVATKTRGGISLVPFSLGMTPGNEKLVAPPVRAVVAVSGCDKANTAHVLTCLLQAMDPAPLIVLQVGIAGALPETGHGPGASVGDVVLATSEAYSDTGTSSPSGWLSARDLGLTIARPVTELVVSSSDWISPCGRPIAINAIGLDGPRCRCRAPKLRPHPNRGRASR